MPISQLHRRRLRRDRRLGGVRFPVIQDFYEGTNKAPFRPECGTRVDDMIARCLYRLTPKPLVPERSRGLWFMFNDYRVTVLRGDTMETAMARFDAARKREHQWYLNSRRYRKHQEQDRRRKIRNQAAFDAALDTRPDNMFELDGVVEWIARWQPHIWVSTKWSPTILLQELQHAGYVEKAHCVDSNDPEKEQKRAALVASRKLMGEYLIGQAMSCMAAGMPPHDVYQHMIKRWRATPA